MNRWPLVIAMALLAWLALSRLPLDGVSVFAVAAAWGLIFGAALRNWWAGVALLIAAIVGDLLAVALGWFTYLGDFWFLPPIVGGIAGEAGGVMSWLVLRPRLLSRWSRSGQQRTP